jgi:hypothetical protein
MQGGRAAPGECQGLGRVRDEEGGGRFQAEGNKESWLPVFKPARAGEDWGEVRTDRSALCRKRTTNY